MYWAQIWSCREKINSQQTTTIWTDLVELESLMLYTKIQPQNFLGSAKMILSVLPYMDMAAILINGPRPFEQIFKPLF